MRRLKGRGLRGRGYKPRQLPEVTVKKAGKGWGVYVDGKFWEFFDEKSDANYGARAIKGSISRGDITKEDIIRTRAREKRHNPEIIKRVKDLKPGDILKSYSWYRPTPPKEGMIVKKVRFAPHGEPEYVIDFENDVSRGYEISDRVVVIGKRRNPEVIDPELTEDIMDSMARTLFVEAWANYIEEEHPEQTRGWAGMDLMDIAPETSPWAHRRAKDLYLKIEEINGLHSILKEVERLDADEDLFGHYLVMESLGHGVAWSDDHEPHNLELPFIETQWDGKRFYIWGV